MQHSIPVEQLKSSLGSHVESMAKAIETCVHCGFCLPTCPTYQILGQEMDSPRGRIVLMKSVLEGDLTITEAIPYINRCLGCQACLTACPSGVPYDELLILFRAYAMHRSSLSPTSRIRRDLINSTFTEADRFRKAVSVGIATRPFRKLMPENIREIIEFLPPRLTKAKSLPEFIPAQGKRRARVGLLIGCVQQVLDPEINWATLRVLAINGVEVVIPSDQKCCGAILMHTGELEQARELARVNMNAFSTQVDAIVTNAAGCGSGIQDYGRLFLNDENEHQVGEIAGRTVDISLFLDQLGLVSDPALPQPLRVAYHDACHLAHAQGITDSPRNLLTRIKNLSLIEIEESSMCCGSAGTYNLDQPAIAKELGMRKAKTILASGAEAVAMGNIGCMVQIRAHLSSFGKLLPVFHTIELLDIAYSHKVPVKLLALDA